MKEVAISEFKAKCLGILEEVRKTAQTDPDHALREAGGGGDSSDSRGANRPEVAWIHGRNRIKLWETSLAPPEVGTTGKPLGMKLLLDTHIWLWSTLEPQRLARRVGKALADPANELWLSPVSVS